VYFRLAALVKSAVSGLCRPQRHERKEDGDKESAHYGCCSFASGLLFGPDVCSQRCPLIYGKLPFHVSVIGMRRSLVYFEREIEI
jgi:hypothetical protein